MAKESLEAFANNPDVINVSYEQPRFFKRVFANFLDIIFLFLAFVSVFIVVEKIVQVTPAYQEADQVVARYREESGLFEYSSSRKTWENVSTWLDNNDDTSYDFRVNKCQKSINNYINYIKAKGTQDDYETIVKDYDEARLSMNMKDEKNNPLFIKVEEEGISKIVHNPNAVANSEYYYNHFYREYTLTNCGGFMITVFPEYHDALSQMSNMLFFIQIPIAALLGGFIVYLLPALIFKRGRCTFGKKLMQIGLVDSRVLSPSFGRYLARWAIFFFLEVVLSFFTFGIPFIISFTMMAFTKRKQGFPDFMLGLVEVDTNKQKIYFDKYEVALEHVNDHKDPVDFEMEKDI